MRVQRMRAVVTVWVVAATSTLANGQAGCEGRSEVYESFDPRSYATLFTLGDEVYMYGGDGTLDRGMWRFSEDDHWERVPDQTRPSAYASIAVEHEAEGVVYAVTQHGETWSWDGDTWTRVASGGPRPETLLYDSARERLLICKEDFEAGIYEFRAGQWDLIGGDAPGVGPGHDVVYDRVRDRLVLFGGTDEDWYYDYQGFEWLWEYDFSSGSWSQVPETGTWPDGRYGHSMYFDAQRGVTVVTGGQASDDIGHACIVYYYPRSDAWAWDGAEWQRIGSAPGQTGMSTVFDRSRGQGIVVGGETYRVQQISCEVRETQYDRTMVRSDGPWTTLDIAVRPAEYEEHRMAYHPGRDGVIAHGGTYYDHVYQYREYVDRSYLYDREGRFSSTADEFWASSVGLAWDPQREQLVGFGGTNEYRSHLWDTYLLGSTGDWQEVAPTTTPPPRRNQAMAWHPGLERVVMYGGTDASVDDRHAWLWDGADWTEHPAMGPSDSYSSSMAYDRDGELLVAVVNGSDTWLFDPTASGGPGDPAWIDAGVQLPLAKARIIEIPGWGILGGARDSGADELYRWNSRGKSWERAGNREPGFVADFAYDPALGAVVFSSEAEWKVSHWSPPCRVDLDCDGATTIFDYLAFQTAFEAGDLRADFDSDGELTILDFLVFQNEFDAGCD